MIYIVHHDIYLVGPSLEYFQVLHHLLTLLYIHTLNCTYMIVYSTYMHMGNIGICTP